MSLQQMLMLLGLEALAYTRRMQCFILGGTSVCKLGRHCVVVNMLTLAMLLTGTGSELSHAVFILFRAEQGK